MKKYYILLVPTFVFSMENAKKEDVAHCTEKNTFEELERVSRDDRNNLIHAWHHRGNVVTGAAVETLVVKHDNGIFEACSIYINVITSHGFVEAKATETTNPEIVERLRAKIVDFETQKRY